MKSNVFIKITIILLLVLPMSCAKFLDQEPQGEWVYGDQKSGSYEAGVFTIYGKLRGFNITTGTPALAIHCFRSEDAEKGSTLADQSDKAAMFDDFQYVTTNDFIAGYYTANYDVIHSANNVIDAIKNADQSTLTDSDKINYGEAHFFRAFAYFNLVRAFGQVPLIDFKVANAKEANIPKSVENDIYALIDADLTIAEKNLPKTWAPIYVGRLTWGAARSLHAKTYMMRNDWANLYTTATDVINSGLYNLNTNFSKIFREEGENNSGSIFEIQCTANATHPGSNEVGSQFAQVQGVRGAGSWDLGWGWHTPTQILADAFEADDPRKGETLLYFIKTGGDPNSIPENKPYGEKPVANADVINAYYNKKAYTNPALRNTHNRFGYWFNIRIIRYSDVLLMAAEAANELGNSGEALNYLEQVRARARREASSAVLPQITTTNQVDLRDAIRHERRVELAMEFDRFYDLVRWGIAQEVLHAAGKTNYQHKHRYLPLPQGEIDRSNGILVQNPDY